MRGSSSGLLTGFSHWTKESYELKAKDVMRYFKKPMEEVTTEELRNFLLKYLKEERKLSERSINYYNSVIRFMYEVTMDKLINKKQLPMYRKRRKMNCCEAAMERMLKSINILKIQVNCSCVAMERMLKNVNNIENIEDL